MVQRYKSLSVTEQTTSMRLAWHATVTRATTVMEWSMVMMVDTVVFDDMRGDEKIEDEGRLRRGGAQVKDRRKGWARRGLGAKK
jgi:hypothetical protein